MPDPYRALDSDHGNHMSDDEVTRAARSAGMTTMTETLASEPDPVLTAIAASYADLDAIRWRVRLADGTRLFIAGERIQDADSDSRVLRFAMADGTEKTFQRGEWASATDIGGPPGPDLDKIIRRLHLLGLASHLDIINQGSWLQRRDEWIEHERKVATPAELAAAEHNHALRKMGL